MQKRLGWRFGRRLSVADAIEPLSSGQRYARRILAVAPNNFVGYWPMWELGGAISYDRSPQGNDGAYTGVTLGQPGIGDGRTCPFFDGATSYNDIYSVPFAADFNPNTGTVIEWVRVVNVGAWTDGVERRGLTVAVDGNNFVILRKSAAANRLDWYYRSGGVQNLRGRVGLTTTGWICMAMTWNKPADEVRAYYNGVQEGATMNGLGVWAGALNANLCVIGAADNTPALVWHGWKAHAALWNAVLTPAQIAELSYV